MRKDCSVCRSEGFGAHARVRLQLGEKWTIATLLHVTSTLLQEGEIGLSEAAITSLGAHDGDMIAISHPLPVVSMSRVRGKIYGEKLEADAFRAIVEDLVEGRYSDVETSAFVTACSARPLDHDEMIGLTHAMVDVGDRIDWGVTPVLDKHCVGGLPGNRTTPILVPIVAACGLVIPKTSSRAITSPAGTADTMETLAPINLDIARMRHVVETEGGCIVWGGAVRLSPADDILIRVERALDIDSEGQLVASVLSKKIAAGATHVVLDLPVGPTAKVRSVQAADQVAADLGVVAKSFGLSITTVRSDGTQPVGRGLGPALEARDVVAVLKNEPDAPQDLRHRALVLAAALLELGQAAKPGQGMALAERVLADGRAWAKMQAICEAQGGMRVPPTAPHRRPVLAAAAGVVSAIDNRRIARVAKLAGAPEAWAAGIERHKWVGDRVERGEPLYTIHAESPGELDYALTYAEANGPIVTVDPA